MKHELNIATPDFLTEDWPGQYDLFSWLEYVVTIPHPIYLVTTRKENGAPNACLHSWGFLVGDRDNFTSLLAVQTYYHTYDNILREGEWCDNYPPVEHYPQAFKTIDVNGPDNDEITDAGLTVEPARVVQAPRIAECPVCLECRLEWHRPLYEGNRWHLMAGRVVHVALDERATVTDPDERLRAMGLFYNVRGMVNPLDGQMYPPNTLGVLDRVLRPFGQGDPE